MSQFCDGATNPGCGYNISVQNRDRSFSKNNCCNFMEFKCFNLLWNWREYFYAACMAYRLQLRIWSCSNDAFVFFRSFRSLFSVVFCSFRWCSISDRLVVSVVIIAHKHIAAWACVWLVSSTLAHTHSHIDTECTTHIRILNWSEWRLRCGMYFSFCNSFWFPSILLSSRLYALVYFLFQSSSSSYFGLRHVDVVFCDGFFLQCGCIFPMFQLSPSLSIESLTLKVNWYDDLCIL